jgi:hypothetical protein
MAEHVDEREKLNQWRKVLQLMDNNTVMTCVSRMRCGRLPMMHRENNYEKKIYQD